MNDVLQRFSANAGERLLVAEGPLRERLVDVVRAFSHGTQVSGSSELDVLGEDLRAFGFEGWGFACGFRGLDAPAMLSQAETDLFSIGQGWAADRLGREPLASDSAFATDGRGFHHVFFRAFQLRHPKRLVQPCQPQFDRGIGRAMWFVAGHERIEETIGRFDAKRRAALWRGVGMAAAFTGGVELDSLRRFAAAGGETFVEGMKLAVSLRESLGHVPAVTKLAAQLG